MPYYCFISLLIQPHEPPLPALFLLMLCLLNIDPTIQTSLFPGLLSVLPLKSTLLACPYSGPHHLKAYRKKWQLRGYVPLLLFSYPWQILLRDQGFSDYIWANELPILCWGDNWSLLLNTVNSHSIHCDRQIMEIFRWGRYKWNHRGNIYWHLPHTKH